MNGYVFEIVEHTTKGSEAYIGKELIINASSLSMKNTRLYFRLKMDYSTNETLKISKIELTSNMYSSEEKDQTIYLMGVFGFDKEHSIKNVLNQLKEQLNGNDAKIFTETKKWNEFALYFINWFENKIKPCLIKEVELNKMYF